MNKKVWHFFLMCARTGSLLAVGANPGPARNYPGVAVLEQEIWQNSLEACRKV